MWLWGKVLNINWSDKVCNKEVLRRVGEEMAIISVRESGSVKPYYMIIMSHYSLREEYQERDHLEDLERECWIE